VSSQERRADGQQSGLGLRKPLPRTDTLPAEVLAALDRIKQSDEEIPALLHLLAQPYLFENLERPTGVVSRLAARIAEWRFRRGEAAGRQLAEREQQAIRQERKYQERLKKRLRLSSEEVSWDRYWSPD
jgi:hypothetical protein